MQTKPTYPFYILFMLIFLTVSWGCAGKDQATQPDPFFDKWREKAATSLPTGPTVGSSKNAVLNTESSKTAGASTPAEADSSLPGKIDKSVLPDTKISVAYIDTNIATVLRSLGRMAGQNIMISPRITGTVNMHIVDTPWNDVFLSIVSNYGLLVSKEDNVLRIMSLDDLKMQVEKETLLMEQKQVSPLVTQIVPIEFSDPEIIKESIKELLTRDNKGNPRGSVSVDTHSRSLIIRDAQENLSTVIEHLQQLDQPTPQILIEAHIVETTKDTARELGAQWGWLMNDQMSGDRFNSIHPPGVNGQANADGTIDYDGGVDGTNRSSIYQQAFGIDLPASAIGSVNPAAIGFLHMTSKGNLLDVQLSALQKKGKVNILSRPSIATLDNIEANIESGAEVPFQTVDENGNIKVEYKDAVLRLKVTPHVISSRLIKLDIEAKKDEVDLTRTVLGNPFIIKKLATTKLIVENGSTVVIAGLSKDRNSAGHIGVPWLKDLPFLGYLFRTDSRSNEFEELLIFITPKILTGNASANIAALETPVEKDEQSQPGEEK